MTDSSMATRLGDLAVKTLAVLIALYILASVAPAFLPGGAAQRVLEGVQ